MKPQGGGEGRREGRGDVSQVGIIHLRIGQVPLMSVPPKNVTIGLDSSLSPQQLGEAVRCGFSLNVTDQGPA